MSFALRTIVLKILLSATLDLAFRYYPFKFLLLLPRVCLEFTSFGNPKDANNGENNGSVGGL